MVEPLTDLLQSVLTKADGKPMTFGQVFEILQHRGAAILIVVFTAPFLFPFQIPGLSVPFGICTLLLGLQIAMPNRRIVPQWILKRELSYPTLEKWINRTKKVVEKVNKVVKHRLPYFVKKPWVVDVNGWCVAILSLIFLIPVPLPLTNFSAAIPIFMIGLGMLEEDGLFILMGYFFCLLAFLAVAGIGFWVSQA